MLAKVDDSNSTEDLSGLCNIDDSSLGLCRLYLEL
jgi:hypothetical protein